MLVKSEFFTYGLHILGRSTQLFSANGPATLRLRLCGSKEACQVLQICVLPQDPLDVVSKPNFLIRAKLIRSPSKEDENPEEDDSVLGTEPREAKLYPPAELWARESFSFSAEKRTRNPSRYIGPDFRLYFGLVVASDREYQNHPASQKICEAACLG